MSTITAITPPKIISRGSRRVRDQIRFARDRSASVIGDCVRARVSAATCIGSVARSAEAYARIEVRVGNIDDQVGEQEQKDRQKHNGLHRRIITRAQSLKSKPTDSWPREDEFDDECAFEDRPELESEQGDAGNQGIAQRVSENHHALGEALRPRGADVVLVQCLEQTGADEARLCRGAEQAQREGWQDQSTQPLEQVVAEVRIAARWKPAEPQRKDIDQNEADKESG